MADRFSMQKEYESGHRVFVTRCGTRAEVMLEPCWGFGVPTTEWSVYRCCSGYDSLRYAVKPTGLYIGEGYPSDRDIVGVWGE